MHSVESIVSSLFACWRSNNSKFSFSFLFTPFFTNPTSLVAKLMSVISLLSSEKPNTDSPANVDAAVSICRTISWTPS